MDLRMGLNRLTAARPTFVDPEAAPIENKTPATATRDLLRSQDRGRLATITNMRGTGLSAAASHTLKRMSQTLDALLGSASTVLSVAGQALFEDAEHGRRWNDSAKSEVNDKHTDRLRQINVKAQQRQKQLDALKKAGFFGQLLKTLGVVGAVLGAISTLATGGGALAILAACAGVAGAVVAATSDSQVAQVISLSLGVGALAGGIVNLLSSGASAALQTGSRIGQSIGTASTLGQGATQLVGAGAVASKGLMEAESLKAQANAEAAEAIAQRDQKEAEQLVDQIDERTQQVGKAFAQFRALIRTQHAAELTAMGGAA